MMPWLWLVLLGGVIGCLGTLIGAGGGFLLVPLLVLLYPRDEPETITGISLAVVFLNALSGSLAYARMRRIDYRAGLLFSAAAIPGAVAGAWVTAQVSRRLFEAMLGILCVAGAAWLLVRPPGRLARHAHADPAPAELAAAAGAGHRGYSAALGAALSFAVGFISSLLGIGGGIVHVPLLVGVLGFPVHVATATSHFVLAVTTLAGTLVHVLTGAFAHGVRRTLALAAGVVPGAQVGAALSNRVGDVWIVRALALALLFAGARMLIGAS